MRLKARIKAMALQHRVPAQAVLQNFMLERLLERIAVSKYKDKLALKGGMLIAAWVGLENRTTKGKILTALLTDSAMKQRWGRYAKDNSYAAAIEFDEAVGVIMEWVGL